MENAKLPESKIQKIIDDLRVGESGWVAPWTMAVDQSLYCWLDTTAAIYTSKCGTAEMFVTRKDGGFFCDIIECESYCWEPRYGRVPGAPVIKLITTETKSAARQLGG